MVVERSRPGGNQPSGSFHPAAMLPVYVCRVCTVCLSVSQDCRLELRTRYSTSPLHASGLAAGSDEGSASTRVAGNPSCTCHLVPAPSAALAAIFAVVIQRLRVVFLQPASCVLLPASSFPQHITQCVVLRVPD